jgi:hypothetical protein
LPGYPDNGLRIIAGNPCRIDQLYGNYLAEVFRSVIPV